MPAEMSALIEALAEVLGRKTSECEQLQQEIARLTERYENLQADYDNDLGHLKAMKEGSRQLRELFAKYGIDKDLNWPEWIAAVSRLTERCDAYKEALASIAANTCCGSCQEAALVAKAVLQDKTT